MVVMVVVWGGVGCNDVGSCRITGRSGGGGGSYLGDHDC